MSDVNNRGTIKWTTMMLPEHAQKLKELRKYQEKKQKPILDDEEINEINLKLQSAIHHD